MISDIVLTEAREGDPIAAQQRLEVLDGFPVLDMTPEAMILVDNLLNAGAVPKQSRPDAQHIAIATLNSIEYLISWNYKHIVNETKLNLT